MEAKDIVKEKCREMLTSTFLSSLPPPKRIIEFNSTTDLTEAFQVLIDNNILSAPVLDVETKEYTGFLDIRDLISFVVYVYNHNQGFKNFKELIKHGSALLERPKHEGVTITYLSRRNRFHPVLQSDNLLQVAKMLSQPDIHRVPVIENGRVVNIISQSTIIQFVADRLQTEIAHRVGPLVQTVQTGTYNHIASVSERASVISAFRIMDEKKFSGVALTDDSGRLVGVTTGKDLGLFLKSAELEVLDRPIGLYLKYLRSLSEPALVPTVAVFKTSKIVYALGLLASTRVHRIFVVDNEQNYHPVGVISITDLLRYISTD